MTPDLRHDPPRDPALERALRGATPDPARARVDWPRLHATVDARAALLLARRRLAWWEHAARWGRAAIPLAAAAAIALSLLLARGAAVAADASASPAPMLEQALAGGTGDPDRPVVGPDDPDWLTQDVMPTDGDR
jgi:hypothetical protein